MLRRIDLNCDMGESTALWPYDINRDILLLPYVSSINIACGYHAGDPDTARQLINEAVARNISIGAHPSFPDKENFGRKAMLLSDKELYSIIYDQIAFMASIAISSGRKIQHVKPHGALYNIAAEDHRLAFIVCSAVQALDEDLMIYGLSGSEIIKIATSMGIQSCSEVFADRTYQDNGTLTPRTEKTALIEDHGQCIRQVLQMIEQGVVGTVNQATIPVKAETICIHSDGSHALEFAKLIHETLQLRGIHISHP